MTMIDVTSLTNAYMHLIYAEENIKLQLVVHVCLQQLPTGE